MSEKKTKLLTMKVTQEEKEEWQKLAASYNMSLAQFIRNLINNKPIENKKVIYKKADPEIIRAIAGIGNNINQIARRINTNEKIDVLIQLRNIEKRLEKLKQCT